MFVTTALRLRLSLLLLYMIHEMTSGYLGKLADMENDLDESKRLQKTLWDIITSETKITQKQLDDIYEKKKDWYLSAEEALEYGLITEII